ncbi:MAG: hypothetical protein V4754_11030 [Pseudomonadota bacterium]
MTNHTASLAFAASLLCACFCTLAQGADPAPQSDCGAKLQTIVPDDPAFKRLETVYRKHLHFGGTVHNIIPHFHAKYEDILKAKKQVAEEDIAFMVYDLARANRVSKRQTVAIGTLTQFGSVALPCLNAALATPKFKGRAILTEIKISIEAANAARSGVQNSKPERFPINN